MSLSRTKSIDRLYADCREFDLVIVPDAPLASALNRRLDRPRIGPFAITPRRLASRRRESAEDRLAFLAVIERTDLGWKEAATAVGEILQCWEHETEPGAIRSYPHFVTPAVRRVLTVLSSSSESVASDDTTASPPDLTSSRLTDYEIDSTRYPSVGVVGSPLLTPLERSILPSEITEVDLFLDEQFELPPVRCFDSPAAVVDALVETISAETAENVAVVLEDGSVYSHLLESALDAADIPFYGGPEFLDDPDHRCLLELLRASYAGSQTRVGDVRALCSHLGTSVSIDHDDKRLAAVEDPALEWIRAFSASKPTETVDGALTTYEEAIDRQLDQLRTELDRLGVLDSPVTESIVDRLAFYFQTYEVPIDRDNAGVLLADATTAASVDRPTVFALGLDDGWTASSPRRPWVDRDADFDRALMRFQSLLQSGREQHLLVVDASGGRPVSPTLYLEELLDDSIERFTDLESIDHSRAITTSGSKRHGFDYEPLDTDAAVETEAVDDPDPVRTISQSRLNSLVNCPRDYLFGRLVDGPDREYFVEGNLFHDFAEFYVCHPEIVSVDEQDRGPTEDTVSDADTSPNDATAPDADTSPNDATAPDADTSPNVDTVPPGDTAADDPELDPAVVDAIVEIILEEIDPFQRNLDRGTCETRCRAGIETLVDFLDEHGPAESTDDEFAFLTSTSGRGDNVFADHFDVSVDSPLTERWFTDETLGLSGVIDLVADPTHIVDYKTGSKTRASTVTKQSALDPPSDTPNYQALCYLTYLRRLRPDEPLQFTFVHFLECLDDVVTGDPSVADCLTTISYRPVAYASFVRSREAFDGLCDDAANACTKTVSQIDYEAYRGVLDDHSIPRTRDATEFADSPVGQALADFLVDRVGDYAYVEKGCTQACRYLTGLRKDTVFADDLDAFESFVTARIDELNAYRRGEERFPVAGLTGEPNYRRVDHRDMIFEGEVTKYDLEPKSETRESVSDSASETESSGAEP